jgi:hypothetical protein
MAAGKTKDEKQLRCIGAVVRAASRYNEADAELRQALSEALEAGVAAPELAPLIGKKSRQSVHNRVREAK